MFDKGLHARITQKHAQCGKTNRNIAKYIDYCRKTSIILIQEKQMQKKQV